MVIIILYYEHALNNTENKLKTDFNLATQNSSYPLLFKANNVWSSK